MQLHRWIGITARVAAGIVAALVATELALRIFVTSGAPPRPDIPADSLDAGRIERRQIEEGVATVHFSERGARLTGNPPMDSGITAIVIGDSYVVAEQVADGETMGAGLERLARANGLALDVRQYGWSGGSPAQYLYAAADVRRRWNPRRIFVTVSANDFDHSALLYSSPRFRVPAPDSLVIRGDAIPPGITPPRGSVLAMLARHRWFVIKGRIARRAAAQEGRVATAAPMVDAPPEEAEPDSAEYARVPRAVIRALARAYGDALTVVYLSEVSLSGDTPPDPTETLMLEACASAGVDCVSTRTAMLEARDRGRMGHGAGIAPLGHGHLNPAGHDVVARVMWDRLRHVAPATTR